MALADAAVPVHVVLGVVVQLLVILPPLLQRVVFVGGYLWFMHAYLSMFLVGGLQ